MPLFIKWEHGRWAGTSLHLLQCDVSTWKTLLDMQCLICPEHCRCGVLGSVGRSVCLSDRLEARGVAQVLERGRCKLAHARCQLYLHSVILCLGILPCLQKQRNASADQRAHSWYVSSHKWRPLCLLLSTNHSHASTLWDNKRSLVSFCLPTSLNTHPKR